MMALWAWLLGALGKGSAQERLYVNYAEEPRASDLVAYETCILDPHCKADLKPGQALGHKFYAYLSLVELAAGSPADDLAKKRAVPVIGANADWGSHLLDVSSQAWWDHLMEDGAAAAVAKGYDGFFLDTADSAERLPGGSPVHEPRLIQLITAMHQRWPTKSIILNRGFPMLEKLKGSLAAILVESVYQGFDPATKAYQANSGSDITWIEGKIRAAQALGLRVYALDYTPVESVALARETVQRLRDLQCVPLITTPDLRGTIIAPKALPKTK
jgi:polysaccharide biosynthesis protein PelA